MKIFSIYFLYFRCDLGWTGSRCNITLISTICNQPKCENDSICVEYGGKGYCICKSGYMGYNCRVLSFRCENITCLNGGTCISLDERTIRWTCRCPIHYFGKFCQYVESRMILHMPPMFTPLIIVHLLHSPSSARSMLLQRSLFVSRHIQASADIEVFESNQEFLAPVIIAQLFLSSNEQIQSFYGSYYLIANNNSNLKQLSVSILNENYCPHVKERLNDTIMSYVWLKRIKFYHRYLKNTRCFYDENYMCLANEFGLPECYNFNHGVANCTDRNYCLNDGRCIQQLERGRLIFSCICSDCFHGSFCQISMSTYTLTIDSILGQVILVDTPITQQPLIVKIFIGIIAMIFIFGLFSNYCSLQIFRHPNIQSYGCGHYFVALTIVNQIGIIMFVCRFIYLLVGQISLIENRLFLSISCAIFDTIVQYFLSSSDWLIGCIACERTVSVIKRTRFNKRQSVRASKFVIIFLFLLLLLLSIHQIFNRQLISDPRIENRLWCVIQFRYIWLQRYDTIINFFHSIIPFIINVISAILLINFF